MSLLRLLPIFCTLLFTLTRKINVKVTKSDEITVKVNLNIFALVLTEEKIKKRTFRDIRKTIKRLKILYKPFEYLLSRSEVVIRRLDTSLANEPSAPMLYTTYIFASMQFLLSYLQRNAKRVKFIETKTYASTFLDLSFYFSFWNLIIFALLYLYYLLSSKIKRVMKNV